MAGEPARGAQTVLRALSILDAFSVSRPSLSLAEISEQVQLTVPTTHRLLKALESRDMVVLEPVTRQYSLGPGIMRLAGVILQRDDVVAIAQARMERLRELTGETVGLHWRAGAERICLVELASRHPVRMASGVGSTYPLVSGAAGKAMLAHLDEPELGDVLARAELPAEARERLLADLAAARRRGYATSVGETVPDAGGLAAAVLDPAGRPIASVNITGPAARFTRARMREAAQPLLDTTAQIMRQLGRSTG